MCPIVELFSPTYSCFYESNSVMQLRPVSSGMSDNKQKSVQLFPNPSDNILHIEAFEPEIRVVLYNAQGEAIKSFVSDNAFFSIDTSDLPNGIYFVSFTGEASTQVSKICVLH